MEATRRGRQVRAHGGMEGGREGGRSAPGRRVRSICAARSRRMQRGSRGTSCVTRGGGKQRSHAAAGRGRPHGGVAATGGVGAGSLGAAGGGPARPRRGGRQTAAASRGAARAAPRGSRRLEGGASPPGVRDAAQGHGREAQARGGLKAPTGRSTTRGSTRRGHAHCASCGRLSLRSSSSIALGLSSGCLSEDRRGILNCGAARGGLLGPRRACKMLKLCPGVRRSGLSLGSHQTG